MANLNAGFFGREPRHAPIEDRQDWKDHALARRVAVVATAADDPRAKWQSGRPMSCSCQTMGVCEQLSTLKRRLSDETRQTKESFSRPVRGTITQGLTRRARVVMELSAGASLPDSSSDRTASGAPPRRGYVRLDLSRTIGGTGQSDPVAPTAHAQTLRRDTDIVELCDADRVPRSPSFPHNETALGRVQRRAADALGEWPLPNSELGRPDPKQPRRQCSSRAPKARPSPQARMGRSRKRGGSLDGPGTPSGARTDEETRLAKEQRRESSVPGRAPRITEHPGDVVVRKHEPVTLRCRADAEPPARLSWFHEGRPVRNSATRMVLPEGQLFFLHVQHSRRDQDTGLYWCTATNALGEARSRNASVELAVPHITGTSDLFTGIIAV
ncbi:hypothetical protein IscW_ISCW022141 [Ixodes scapularis]|uniref:Ig-like domain-containing protein n=1 Tax=Ixodes scapularis TaxID=6945 RepID=B7QEN0_IXOSC|nr:hypothetical protein IscW_ISCW022141 [Ixodes scapularis]|eukprot:XP_002413994.1 hypothetical protein IscW_ISCW022141 [Ixodes scapularis]